MGQEGLNNSAAIVFPSWTGLLVGLDSSVHFLATA